MKLLPAIGIWPMLLLFTACSIATFDKKIESPIGSAYEVGAVHFPEAMDHVRKYLESSHKCTESFSTGNITDTTGFFKVTLDGTGSMYTQGISDIVQNGLLALGVNADEQIDMSVMQRNLTAAQQGVLTNGQVTRVVYKDESGKVIKESATHTSIPPEAALKMRAPTYYIAGTLAYADVLPGGHAEVIVGGIGGAYNQNRQNLRLYLRLVDASSGANLAGTNVMKQVANDHMAIEGARNIGGKVQLFEFSIGQKRREEIQKAVAGAAELGTLYLIAWKCNITDFKTALGDRLVKELGLKDLPVYAPVERKSKEAADQPSPPIATEATPAQDTSAQSVEHPQPEAQVTPTVEPAPEPERIVKPVLPKPRPAIRKVAVHPSKPTHEQRITTLEHKTLEDNLPPAARCERDRMIPVATEKGTSDVNTDFLKTIPMEKDGCTYAVHEIWGIVEHDEDAALCAARASHAAGVLNAPHRCIPPGGLEMLNRFPHFRKSGVIVWLKPQPGAQKNP